MSVIDLTEGDDIDCIAEAESEAALLQNIDRVKRFHEYIPDMHDSGIQEIIQYFRVSASDTYITFEPIKFLQMYRSSPKNFNFFFCIACYAGNLKAAKYILENGDGTVEINAAHENEYHSFIRSFASPLALSVAQNYCREEVPLWLITLTGINLNVKCGYGESFLYYIIKNQFPEEFILAFLARSPDVHYSPCGELPLILAVQNNLTSCVLAMLALGADPFRENAQGDRAIDFCRDKDPAIEQAIFNYQFAEVMYSMEYLGIQLDCESVEMLASYAVVDESMEMPQTPQTPSNDDAPARSPEETEILVNELQKSHEAVAIISTVPKLPSYEVPSFGCFQNVGLVSMLHSFEFDGGLRHAKLVNVPVVTSGSVSGSAFVSPSVCQVVTSEVVATTAKGKLIQTTYELVDSNETANESAITNAVDRATAWDLRQIDGRSTHIHLGSGQNAHLIEVDTFRILLTFDRSLDEKDASKNGCIILPHPAHHNISRLAYPLTHVLPNTFYEPHYHPSAPFEVRVPYKTKVIVVKLPEAPYHRVFTTSR
jgi:hypothetical protein